jgi:hypothetical protein
VKKFLLPSLLYLYVERYKYVYKQIKFDNNIQAKHLDAIHQEHIAKIGLQLEKFTPPVSVKTSMAYPW